MNVKTIKYKAIAFCLVSALLFSGCSDFLDRGVEDQYAVENAETMPQYLRLTGALYGGTMWIGYHGKFDWMVSECLSGNMFHDWSDEGAFFLGNVTETNTYLAPGYKSLFSGVISSSNFIINNKNFEKNISDGKLTRAEADQIIAEARMFRGLAYFLATELWGEVPLVLNNEKVISDQLQVPKANRATIYKLIEMDWKFASEHLPDDIKWRDGRVSKWGAKGMLGKLYLTIASCQSPERLACPFRCEDLEGKDYRYYYEKARDLALEVINSRRAELVPYADIFAIQNSQYNLCNESLFAIHLADFGYDTGSQSQAQFGYNDFWSPGSGWGVGKSMTYTLFESYQFGDKRKKEVCFYQEFDDKPVEYKNWKGEIPKKDDAFKLSSTGPVNNNIKKYVYGYASPYSNMSSPRRLDFLRLADVYLICAEAKMGLEADATTPTAAGMVELRAVVEAHAGASIRDSLPTEMAFYTPVPFTRKLVYRYEGLVDDGVNVPKADPDNYYVEKYVPERRVYDKDKGKNYADLMQERRKEFVFEGQGWLDLKRLYYRNPQYAKNFLKEQDRGWRFTQRWSETGDTENPEVAHLTPEKWVSYVRSSMLEEMYMKYPAIRPSDHKEGDYTDGAVSKALEDGNFNDWFLPIPTIVKSQLPPGPGQDFRSELENGTYKW